MKLLEIKRKRKKGKTFGFSTLLLIVTALLNIQQKKHEHELSKLREELAYAAEHDALTGLYNRRYLNKYIEKLIRRGQDDFYIALVDLDYFKKINDDYGHIFGDKVLVTFSRILQKNLTDEGIAVRFGGEEFMLILPHVSAGEVSDMLEHVRSEYSRINKVKQETEFTFCCGVQQYQEGIEIQSLLDKADAKMYQAKQMGKNKIIF